jgi:hypothetical protein
VAEQERLTNKERRAKAREERKRKEAEAARKRKRNAIRNGLIGAVVFGLVTAVVLQAVLGGDASIDDPVLVSSSEVDDAEQAAGCETLVEREPLEEAGHFERNDAPPAELIYPEIRPTHSGPHTSQTFPPVPRGASEQIDEKTSTHNLEHGAVIVWYDPDQVDDDTVDEMGSWSEALNNSGFNQQGGALVYVSPYEDPGISSGQAIALRSWGTAVDCDEWDETVGNGFVARNYGTRGIGPEAGAFAGYPEGVLDISDEDAPEGEPEDVDQEVDEEHDTEGPLDDEGEQD